MLQSTDDTVFLFEVDLSGLKILFHKNERCCLGEANEDMEQYIESLLVWRCCL